MPPKKDGGKPKGAMTSYAAFVQVCRDEHKKKHPEDQINFAEFSKKCSERWKSMSAKEKKRFEDIAGKDKARYQREMATYVPVEGDGKKKRKTKDPNAPKRALSAFFFFCNEFRAEIKAKNPEYSVGDIAKELGKRWEKQTDRSKYEKQAADDKKRYEKEMSSYGGGGASAGGAKKAAKSAPAAKKSKAAAKEPSSEEEEEDEEDEDDEEYSD